MPLIAGGTCHTGNVRTGSVFTRLEDTLTVTTLGRPRERFENTLVTLISSLAPAFTSQLMSNKIINITHHFQVSTWARMRCLFTRWLLTYWGTGSESKTGVRSVANGPLYMRVIFPNSLFRLRLIRNTVSGGNEPAVPCPWPVLSQLPERPLAQAGPACGPAPHRARPLLVL